MEELKTVLEALGGLGEHARWAFIVWCLKCLMDNIFIAGTLLGLGAMGYRLARNWQLNEMKLRG